MKSLDRNIELLTKLVNNKRYLASELVERGEDASVEDSLDELTQKALDLDGAYDTYDGSYEIKPLANEQTLPTKDKLMASDMKVLAISYSETTNTKNGITVTIGG